MNLGIASWAICYIFRESQEVSPESEMVKGVYEGFKKKCGPLWPPPAANRVKE